MKVYRRRRGIAPLILSLGIRQARVVNLTLWLLAPWQRTTIPIEQGAQCGPEPSGHFKDEKNLFP